MKGIVAETNGKYAIILTQNGIFKKIKAEKHMTVGCEIDMNQPIGILNGTRYITKVVSIAAAALLVMGVGFGAYSYTIPYSYVDVDINPSIELTTNIYDRIIGVEALNEDGRKLLNDSNLKNARLESGISQLISIATEQGYLKAYTGSPDEDKKDASEIIQGTGGTTPAAAGITNSSIAIAGNTATSGSITVDGSTTTSGSISAKKVTDPENAVLLTVSSKNGSKSEALKKEIVVAVSKELDKSSVNSKVLIGQASVKQRDDARKLGVTPGKLALIEDALESEPELKLEKLKEEAVKDLINRAKQKKAAEAEKETAKEEKKNTQKNSQNNTGTKDAPKKTDALKEQKVADGKAPEPLVDLDRKNNSGKWTDNNQSVQGGQNDYDSMSEKTGKSDKSGNNSANNKDTDAGNITNNKGGANDSNNPKDKSSTKGENNTKNKNSSNNWKNQSNTNMDKIRQEITDALNREKQDRQKLKDELLEQISNNNKNNKNGKDIKDNREKDDEQDDKDAPLNKKNRTGASDKNNTGSKNKDTGKWNVFGGKR